VVVCRFLILSFCTYRTPPMRIKKNSHWEYLTSHMQAGDRCGGNYGADGGGDIIYRMDYKRIMMVIAGESVCMSGGGGGGGDWVVTTRVLRRAKN